MTAMAIAGNQDFTVSRYEIDQPEPSFTVNTMRYFKEKEPSSDLYFITGADSS